MELKDYLMNLRGCEFCAKFDFETGRIIFKTKYDLKDYTVYGKSFAYCPLCGRKIEDD